MILLPRRHPLPVLTLIAAGLPASAQHPSLRPPAVVDPVPILTQSSQALPFLAWDHLLCGREPRILAPPKVARNYRAALRPILHPAPRPFDRDKLIAALGHESPRVRTLAALALFDTSDPAVLPHLAKLAADDAQTFPTLLPVSAIALPKDDAAWQAPTSPQTVGGAVRWMLDFYTRRVGADPKRFAVYWEPRKDRQYCTSWFAAQLDRITGATSRPTPDPQAMSGLLGRIQALPPADRDWVMVALFADPGLSAVVTTDTRLAAHSWRVDADELLYAARRRGRAALLGVLRGASPTDDPDLPHYRGQIVRFVLAHAERLLAPGDADELLAIGLADEEAGTAWFQAAARLAPARAAEILHAGLGRLPKHAFTNHLRLSLVVDLWRLVGAAEADFVVEWFFDPSQVQLGVMPARTGLLEVLAKRYAPADRALLRRLIEDPRLDRLDSQTVREMVSALNRVLPAPLVDPAKLWSLSHPYGLSHFDAAIDKATAAHPGPTRALLATLADWRSRIRAALPQLK